MNKICILGYPGEDLNFRHITKKKKKKKKAHLFKYMKNFPIKNSNIFHISTQNIDCGYPLEPPCGSNEYPQSMLLEAVLTSTHPWGHNLYFLAKVRKIMYAPVNPSFTI